MRIVILTPSLELGGAERSLVKLVRLIHPEVDCIDVICMARANETILQELPRSVNVTVMERGATANPLLWARVYSIFRRLRPDVIVGWSTYANLVALLISRFFPEARVVISERNYVPEMFRRVRTGLFRRRIVLSLMRSMYARAHLITANSSDNLRFLRRFVGRGATYCLLPNTIDVSGIDRLAVNDVDPVFSGVAGPRLLAVGRLDAQKGFDLLLDALARVRKSEPWELVIVGDGPERGSLQSQAARLGLGEAVHWVGAVENPFPYYRWADVVLLPSRYEGFPNVLLEAMAVGRAVVACDCRTGPRELTDGGRLGLLVPVGDTDALAAAILRIGLDHEQRKKLGEAARSHVIGVYDVGVTRRSYLDALESRA